MRNVNFRMPGTTANAFTYCDQIKNIEVTQMSEILMLKYFGKIDWGLNFINDLLVGPKKPINLSSLYCEEVAETIPGVATEIGRLKAGLMTVAGLSIDGNGGLSFEPRAFQTNQKVVIQPNQELTVGNYKFGYEKGKYLTLTPLDQTVKASAVHITRTNQLIGKGLATLENKPLIFDGNANFLVSHGSLGSAVLNCEPIGTSLYVNSHSYTSNEV